MSSRPTPPLTVLMAFHNDAPFIAEAIDSILNQTYDDFEFVIVNDASNDGSRDIVARYTDPRIRLLDNPENLRLARSLNRGLEVARGALVARLDANDVARPDRLEKQMRFMRDHPEIALLGGQYEVIDTHSRRLALAALPKPVTELGVQWYFLIDSPFIHSTVMFRKSAADKSGRYNPASDWAPSEDVVLWAQMALDHRMVNMPDVLVLQRYDPRSITYDRSKPYRTDFEPRLTRFFVTNINRILLVDDADVWAGLMTALFVDDIPVSAETMLRYIDAIEAMEQRFVALHPEAVDNLDVRRGMVQLLTRALFRMALCSRLASLPILARMLRADTRTTLRHLPKYVAVGLFGSRAWDVWRWWRGLGQEQRT
ncbi:MAG TPA: glycosyltransferase [Thermoanaerobaculia bacterium]|jgi:glycosyltransferase involved in cell wall biosynthesis|nr:glycosyltransferase [Thermoanaerobaculia bacterium]